ncbi:hypothetical protein BSKO_10669 [Bryopsis sp. KO-2023]|nr:hypothetical protein BSKO_10669 [Bryopsis sp. KO-2023]
METSLRYGSNDRQLSVALREKIVANDVQFKFNGLLNTVTGQWQHRLALHRFFLPNEGSRALARKCSKRFQHRASFLTILESDPGPKADIFRVGLHGRGRCELDSTGDVWLKAEINSMYEPRSQQFKHLGVAQVNRVFKSITSNQDLKVSAEVRLELDHRGNAKTEGAVTIRENNWGINLGRNNWFITYDL